MVSSAAAVGASFIATSLLQLIDPRRLPLSAPILARFSFHWNSYVQMQVAWPRLFIQPIMAGPA